VQHRYHRIFLASVMFALMAVAGCATAPARVPRLSPSFYGVWTNVDPHNYNWWEIGPERVVNYGIALDRGSCGGYGARVIASDALDIPFGNSSAVRLSIVDGELIFSSPSGRARHMRAAPQSICRMANGTYFTGAPYADRTD